MGAILSRPKGPHHGGTFSSAPLTPQRRRYVEIDGNKEKVSEMMKKSAIALAGSLVVFAAACSTGQVPLPTGAPPALTKVITVSEGDMFLHPSTTTVASGKVTFTVTNDGQMDHEFVVVTGDPSGTTGDEPGRVSEAAHIGGAEGPEIGNINPGQTKTLTAQLNAGTYTAMCNLPGHFGAGMEFQFVVE